jgi:hypothetical protein
MGERGDALDESQCSLLSGCSACTHLGFEFCLERLPPLLFLFPALDLPISLLTLFQKFFRLKIQLRLPVLIFPEAAGYQWFKFGGNAATRLHIGLLQLAPQVSARLPQRVVFSIHLRRQSLLHNTTPRAAVMQQRFQRKRHELCQNARAKNACITSCAKQRQLN